MPIAWDTVYNDQRIIKSNTCAPPSEEVCWWNAYMELETYLLHFKCGCCHGWRLPNHSSLCQLGTNHLKSHYNLWQIVIYVDFCTQLMCIYSECYCCICYIKVNILWKMARVRKYNKACPMEGILLKTVQPIFVYGVECAGGLSQHYLLQVHHVILHSKFQIEYQLKSNHQHLNDYIFLHMFHNFVKLILNIYFQIILFFLYIFFFLFLLIYQLQFDIFE